MYMGRSIPCRKCGKKFLVGRTPAGSADAVKNGDIRPGPNGEQKTSTPSTKIPRCTKPAPTVAAGQTTGPAQTVAAGQTSGPAPTVAAGQTSGPAPTVAAGQTSGPAQTVAAGQTTGPAQTVAAGQTTGPAQTVAAGQTTGPAQTVTAGQTTGPAQTVAAGQTTGPAQTVAAGQTTGPAQTVAAGIDVASAHPAADENIARPVTRTNTGWAPGHILLDLYEVKGLLGQGGMGEVYQVHHKEWNVDLAVKVPRLDFLAGKIGVEQFEREAEHWVNLGLHPHIVSCYYIRRIAQRPSVFAEYVAGGSMHDWIVHEGKPGRLYRKGPDQALTTIIDVAIQFAWGLQYAHDRGLIHLDVKPANVMISENGQAKVTDFGLALALRSGDAKRGADSGTSTPGEGSAPGTPQYFSAEQAARKPLGPHSDMWSWALCILEMFKGGRTWEFGSVAGAVLEEYLAVGPEADWLPRMPVELADLLRKCFLPEPTRRPANMQEAARSLIRIFEDLTGSPYPRSEPVANLSTADSLNNRAVSLRDLGQTREAEALWLKATEIEPHHPEATYNRGLALWRSARLTDEALVQILLEAGRSHGDQWVNLYLLALVHLERDDCRAAHDILQKLSEPDRERHEVKSALAAARIRSEQSNQWLMTYEGHTGGVNAVSLTGSGLYVVSGGENRSITVWETHTGNIVKTMEASGPVNAISVSRDGLFALTGGGDYLSKDFALRFWDLHRGTCIREIKGHKKKINAVQLSDDGSLAISASDDRTVRIWDMISGRCRRTLLAGKTAVTAVHLNSESQQVFSGGTGGIIKVWDIETGRWLKTLSGHKGSVTALSSCHKGHRLLSGGTDSSLVLWDTETGERLLALKGHRDAVNAAGLSTDGRFAFSAGSDQTLKMWNAETGRCLRTYEGHSSYILSLSIHRGGKYAVTGSLDKTLRRWRTDGAALTFRAPMMLSMVSSSEDTFSAAANYERNLAEARQALAGKDLMLAAAKTRAARAQPGFARGEEAMRLWRRLYVKLPRQSLTGAWEACVIKEHGLDVTGICPSRNGRMLLSGSLDRTVRLWKIPTGECLGTLRGHEAEVNAVHLSRSGRLALSGGQDRRVRLWSTVKRKSLRVFTGHDAPIYSLAMTPDETLFFAGGSDGKITIWDPATGGAKGELTGHRTPVNDLDISLDGRYLLSGGGDFTDKENSVKLWDLKTGRCLNTLTGHERTVDSVRLGHDGRTALSASSDGTIKLWQPATGECLKTLRGHNGSVSSICLSADGRFVLSGGFDHTIRLWETATDNPARIFKVHAAPVTAVAITRNGRFALSAGRDHLIKVLSLDWELGNMPSTRWHKGAAPWLRAFLNNLEPQPEPPDSTASPWSGDDLKDLLQTLGCAGFGWINPGIVRRELIKMFRASQK